jgi:tryptophan synthase alpha chain
LSAVERVLRDNKSSGRGSLVGYYPVGYPNLDASVEAAIAMAKAGVDVLELGVPYSDPVMDGEMIQRATETARENGFRLTDTFSAIRQIRSEIETPILVMTYWNPVLRFGVSDFASNVKSAGGDGLITPDLIPDEGSDWLAASDDSALDRVFLVAPSSSDERVENNSNLSRGFVYAVSTMGITGERSELDAKARTLVGRVRERSKVPTCVGIGVSTSDQIREINSYADGAIVGTAFIRAYEAGGLSALSDKVTELAGGLG